MKTLDEVIKAFEICIGYYCSNAEHDVCPYFGESDMGCMKEPEKDALHYLKVLQKMQKAQPVTKGEWDELYNSPLTWDELLQMNDKPVWVEVDGNWYGKFWAFIEVGNDAYMNFYPKGQEYPVDLWKRDIGKIWQAYRKERE